MSAKWGYSREEKTRYCSETGRPLVPYVTHWIHDENNGPVAIVCAHDATASARAAIIAAAPEMLSALVDALDELKGVERQLNSPDVLSRVRAAIAKATGGEK